MRLLFITFLIVGGIAAGHAQEGFYYIKTGQPVPAEEQADLLSMKLGLFDSDTPLELKFISNFNQLIEKKEDSKYQEAILIFSWSDEIELRWSIRVKARGHSRRTICRMPPLKLDFTHDEVALTGLRDLEKMKMVSYCKKGKLYEQYLFKEYLTYQMYDLFSPVSFRTRLIKMTYVDTGRKNKEYEGYAFLIEEVDRLERRLEAEEVEKKNMHPDSADYKHVNQLAIFQFMIGNLDWSIPGLHNIKILRRQEASDSVLYCVPYDFDYSGLVNAHYAIPPKRLKLNSVRDRYFLGFCRTEAEFEEALEVFRAKEPEIYAVVESSPYLSKIDRKSMLSYLDSFYELISTEEAVQKYFLETCRK